MDYRLFPQSPHGGFAAVLPTTRPFESRRYRLHPQQQKGYYEDGICHGERNIGKPLAIFLDGMSIVDTDGDNEITFNDFYAPIVQGKITGGRAVITGNMNISKAKEIIQRLNSGALPVPIKLISQQTVGPTLGAMSLQKSLKAGIIGALAIILFMILFYRLPGVLASLALGIYLVLILSINSVILFSDENLWLKVMLIQSSKAFISSRLMRSLNRSLSKRVSITYELLINTVKTSIWLSVRFII